MNLPTLTGSEKQISWATVIRENVMIYLQEYIDDANVSLKRAIETKVYEEQDTLHEKTLLNKKIDKFIKLQQVTDSGLYIDYFANYSRLCTMDSFLASQRIPLTADQAKYLFEANRARIATMCMNDLMRCPAI